MKKAKFNQPLVEHIFTADPSAHVFEGKIYIYPSHDLDNGRANELSGAHYAMEDYHVFSMDDIDQPVVDHGQILHMNDVAWVKNQMWAPDAAYKDGKYYFYFPARDENDIFRIGVATADSPTGPFIAEPNYIPGSYSIDPAVFIDDDGKAYMYVGGLRGGQLENWETGEFVADATEPTGDVPALMPYVAEMTDDMLTFKAGTQKKIQILTENSHPLLASDLDRLYFEGPWMHKYNGKYYLSYSTGDTHYLVYATSDSPTGPFTYQGRILEPVVGWTTHHSIVEFNEKWYLFYHDAKFGGKDNLRTIKFRELHYNEDGTIKPMHPYED